MDLSSHGGGRTGRSVGQSVSRSVGQSVGRSVDRSVRRSVGPSVCRSSKYFQKVLKERFLNLIDVRLVIIRLREASLLVVLSVGFQKILKN